MKVSIRGLVALRPFDESMERDRAEGEFMKLSPLAVSLGLAFLISIVACALAFFHSTSAVPVLCLAIGANGITSIIEWRLGLRARACNRLFGPALILMGISLSLRISA